MAARRNILFVFARGGPPLEYSLPRIAERGDVHFLAVRRPPSHTEKLWRGYCTSVIAAPEQGVSGGQLAELIAERAKEVHADAIVTSSEFALLAVSEAAQRLGLRSAGPNTIVSRDKRRMRAAWHQAGVPSPRFLPVSSRAELEAAYRELTPPVMLKAAWGAGSIAQQLISSAGEIGPAWDKASAAVAEALSAGSMELSHSGAIREFLVEELIRATTCGWWPDGSGYGDYLSVEGIVADGIYHPLCIASRMPTIEPFTELSNLIPCALPESSQRTIESAARTAVDALGLQTCATHTEMKLMENGEVCLLESAARFGGFMIAPEIEEVFGLDTVGMLVDSLLGDKVEFPEQMLTSADASGSAASLALIATDSAGTPWSRELAWNPQVVDWSAIISAGTRIELVPGFSIPAGSQVPAYDLTSGNLNYGGVFFVRAPRVDNLLRDLYAVLDNLEAALGQAALAQ